MGWGDGKPSKRTVDNWTKPPNTPAIREDKRKSDRVYATRSDLCFALIVFGIMLYGGMILFVCNT
jgi:hypothetical protein